MTGVLPSKLLTVMRYHMGDPRPPPPSVPSALSCDRAAARRRRDALGSVL